ncbi:MAG: hypothetical protein LBU36_04950 [Clostridiales bacterium]|jgi:hypothetical protein|nr:hypothetical protein [Clostridiales bacterium]
MSSNPLDFSTGDRVRVHSGTSSHRDGEIIYKGNSFFTVKFKHYSEAFQYFELKTGSVRVEAAR